MLYVIGYAVSIVTVVQQIHRMALVTWDTLHRWCFGISYEIQLILFDKNDWNGLSKHK